jgi:hypothetical protein
MTVHRSMSVWIAALAVALGSAAAAEVSTIAPNNVASLGLAWSTALDAGSGKLKWQFPYDPSYIISR